MKHLVILRVLLPLMSWARLRVAFVEMQGPNGRRIELEPGGTFAHVAVEYGNHWLQTYPPGPAKLISWETLRLYGQVTVLTLEDSSALTETQVQKILGQPYDYQFSWTSNALYSSELVGKILNLEPTKMTFESEFWKDRPKPQASEKGLSPDDIFKILSRRPASIRQVLKSADEKTPGSTKDSRQNSAK